MTYLCTACGKECQPLTMSEDTWIEAWGMDQWHRTTIVVSDCCEEPIQEVKNNHEPKNDE